MQNTFFILQNTKYAPSLVIIILVQPYIKKRGASSCYSFHCFRLSHCPVCRTEQRYPHADVSNNKKYMSYNRHTLIMNTSLKGVYCFVFNKRSLNLRDSKQSKQCVGTPLLIYVPSWSIDKQCPDLESTAKIQKKTFATTIYIIFFAKTTKITSKII